MDSSVTGRERPQATVSRPAAGDRVFGTPASSLCYASLTFSGRQQGVAMRKTRLALIAIGLVMLAGYAVLAQQAAPAAQAPVPPNLPEWAWGVMPPAPPPVPGAKPPAPPVDDGTLIRIEGS